LWCCTHNIGCCSACAKASSESLSAFTGAAHERNTDVSSEVLGSPWSEQHKPAARKDCPEGL